MHRHGMFINRVMKRELSWSIIDQNWHISTWKCFSDLGFQAAFFILSFSLKSADGYIESELPNIHNKMSSFLLILSSFSKRTHSKKVAARSCGAGLGGELREVG